MRDFQFLFFPETKDNDSNAHPLRNAAVKRCSYMWELTAAKCGWWNSSITAFLGTTEQQVDTNGDGIVSWQEVKEWQFAHGDTANNFKPYSEVDPPEIRCMFHSGTNANAANDTDPCAVLNITVAGNIRRTGYQWEKVAQ